MILTGHQPNYLPNLDFFAKMAAADIFVVATRIETDTQGKWQMRNRLDTANGQVWLIVPTHKSHNTLIKDIKISNTTNWRHKHFKTLKNFYNQKEGSQHLKSFQPIYEQEWTRLVDLNFSLIKLIKELLNIKTRLILDEDTKGKKHENFIKLCKKNHADTFLSGKGAKSYLKEKDIKEIEKEGIRHVFMDKSLGSKYPYSAVHYLLTYGKDWIKNVIT